jgi:membrane protein YdbS with pleckstrin-like domain
MIWDVMAPWLRYLLTLMASGLGFMAGLIGCGAFAAGIGWIFLFGDDPWPSWSDAAIIAAALIGGVVVGAAVGLASWRMTEPN